MARKKINSTIEKNVLISSKRRCALCYGLDSDLSIKQGQIAHIDKNHNNNAEDNLLFLCLDHHDAYDTITSQSKGITKSELEHYRDKLYDFLISDEFNSSENEMGNWDKRIFNQIHNWLFTTNAMQILQNLNLAGYFSTNFLDDLEAFRIMCFEDPSFCFKNTEMEKLKMNIYHSIDCFGNLLMPIQFDYNREKYYIPKNLSNYGELCRELDKTRALACRNYHQLIRMGIQLNYI